MLGGVVVGRNQSFENLICSPKHQKIGNIIIAMYRTWSWKMFGYSGSQLKRRISFEHIPERLVIDFLNSRTPSLKISGVIVRLASDYVYGAMYPHEF